MKNEIKAIAESIIGRKLTIEDGISISKIKDIENKLECKIPTELKDFYNLIGNLDMFMSSFEDFPEPYLIGNKIVFLEENQGVCYWGINKDDSESPTVYVCTDIESENLEWYSESVNLAEFLKIIMYFQCAQGGCKHGGAIYDCNFKSKDEYVGVLNKLVHDWQKVVEHNGLVIFQNRGKLVWYFTDEQGSIGDTIFASTYSELGMKELEIYGFKEL